MTLTSYAIGNAVVDARIQLAGTEFLDSRISRGASIRVTPQEARAIVANFDPSRVRITGGGSVANSTVAIAHCGGRLFFVARQHMMHSEPSSELNLIVQGCFAGAE